ncbi:MAG: CGNR zinc finger domain-containing protein [Gammaproteobacteria bacterium]|nr:CGNR zinc finger domain-containing protein [Gammaproteobacteria bacterium]
MSEHVRPAPFFIADNRALDFLNSVVSPSGTEIEWLSNGSDLLDWLEQARLVSVAELKPFRNKKYLHACDAVAAQARELREWIRTFVMAYAGRSVDEAALSKLDFINKLLERGSSFNQINLSPLTENNHENGSSPLQCQRKYRYQEPQDLLIPIADVMSELLCEVNFWHVKQCEGPTCTMMFNDVSKNHRRRWCMMSVCGNRAKAAQHRARKKSAHTENKP